MLRDLFLFRTAVCRHPPGHAEGIRGGGEGVLTAAVDWKNSRFLPNEVIALPPCLSLELFPDFPVPLCSPAAPGPVRVRNGSGPLHPEEGQTLTFATRASGP